MTADLDLPLAIEEALCALPQKLLDRSGSVFYTSKLAFMTSNPIYLLGLNPGGDPLVQARNTVGRHIAEFRDRTSAWSEYRDEIWEGSTAGSWGMQPRILHLLKGLGLEAHTVPASNVVFARTRTEADLEGGKDSLLGACWPVHQAVINSLQVRTIVCLGGTAGRWVRERLGADAEIDRHRETNARGWKSSTHASPDGQKVVTLTHPGRADWRNPAADPTALVRRAIRMTGPE